MEWQSSNSINLLQLNKLVTPHIINESCNCLFEIREIANKNIHGSPDAVTNHLNVIRQHLNHFQVVTLFLLKVTKECFQS